ncbi:MAG TPA: tetratricopeptide repeat protein [Candidatus Acidoferrales bacterium]|jgi:tetratricopeptide (TPR) repeat protein|nr:tetratricopeptide repeat protein [Candidatus Acidoferrales bacterium]
MKTILRLAVTLAVVAWVAVLNTGCTAKMKKAYHESRADKYYAAGQLDRAEIEYLNVLRNDHENAKAFSRLGFIYFDQGRFTPAAMCLIRASTLATNDLDVHMKLGMVYAAAGRMKEAREQAIFVLDRDPKMDQAPILLAQTAVTTQEVAQVQARLDPLMKTGNRAAYEVAEGMLAFRGGDIKATEAAFRRALVLDPKSVDALGSLGALQTTQNNLKEAEANLKAAADLSPVRSAKRMVYARFKLQTGHPDEAQQLLEDVVKQAPDYIPALMGLAEIDMAAKKYDASREYLTKALARDGDNFEGMMLDSRLRFTQGDIPGTVTTLERMTRTYPESARVHFQLGAAYLASGDEAKGAASLNRALELDPGDADAVMLLAQLQIKNGNADAAINAVGRVMQKYPQMVQAQLLLADAYRLRNRFNEALEIYAKLEKQAPTNTQVLLLEGATELQTGDKALARQKFERVLVSAPNSLPALEQLADLDIGEKSYTAANELIQTRLNQEPTNLVLNLLVAKVQLAAGNREAAQQTLLKLAAMEPQNDQPHLMLAQLYFEAKQTDQAKEQLDTALKLNPKNLATLMTMASSKEKAKDYKGAAATYEKILELDPKCSPALNNLAYLYSENLGQPDRAYELAQRARALLPADPSTADTLGWINVKRGAYPTALALLQESAAKLPGVPDVQYHLGMANYMMMAEAAARAAFQLALAGGKDFTGKEECQLCLAVLNTDPQTADASAVEKLEKRVSDRPDDPVAQGRLGAIYQRQGKTDKAIACYEAVYKTDAKNLVAPYNLARLYEAQDAAKAYGFAKAAYKLAPNNAEVTHVYGRLAYQSGDFKLANTMLQGAVQGQPGDAATQFDYARAAYSLGKVAAAQAALQAASAGNLPAAQAGEAKRMADLITLADNPQASAGVQITQILKAEPDYVPALMVQAKLSELAGDAGGAIATCEKITAKFADFAPAERELAILYAKDSSKATTAYAYAVKAREEYPSDPALAKATGIILFQQGEFTRAASMLRECSIKANTDPEIFYYLGAAQLQLKQNIAGKTSLQQALALKLSGPLADSAKQLLNAK